MSYPFFFTKKASVGGIMRQDNIVIVMLNKLTDLVVLNLLFFFCSLPVITIGASICGLYAVNLRSVRFGDGYVIKTFFSGFKKSFKQATIVWLFTLFFAWLFFVDLRFWMMNQTPFSKPMLAISLVMVLFFVMILHWLFPLIAKTVDTLPRLLKNAKLMAVGYFIPYTVIIMAITFVAFFLAYVNAGMLFIMILIGFSLVTYLQSFFIYKVFAKHMKEISAGDDDLLYMCWEEQEEEFTNDFENESETDSKMKGE